MFKDVKEILKTLIVEWKNYKPEVIEREENFLYHENKINIIAGPRRVGKTYFLFQLMKNFEKEYCFYINFEDERIFDTPLFLTYLIPTIKELYNPKKIILFLDEIQNISNYQKWLRRILEKKEALIFVSGSSSKLLNVSTELRGRSLSYILFPLSFKDFLKFLNFKIENLNLLNYDLNKKAELLNLLNEFLIYGSFPEIVLENNKELKIKFLREYYNTTFYKDLIEKHNIKNIKALDILMKAILNSYSKEFSFSKVYNFLKSLGIKVGKQTLINYFQYLQEGFFVIPLYKFSKSYKEKEINMKVYIFNIGFVRALLNKEEIGKKMENTVFLHLKRQENNSPLQEIYYYKTNEGYEVDFLIKEKNQIKELINVTYANSYDEINKREIRALLHAKEELKLSDNIPLTIITWDYEDEKEISWFGKKGRIRFIPLWKWLLNN